MTLLKVDSPAQAFAAIADLVQGNTGLSFPADRRTHIDSACRRLMADYGISSPEALSRRLPADTELFDALVSLITIPESYFFRDNAHFDYIASHVLPALRAQRQADHVFRAWSAGCAGGEEAYSLAILLEEHGLFPQQATVVGSDISRRSLKRAREGRYTAWSVRGKRAVALSPGVLAQKGRDYAVDQRFRARVQFLYLNLASAAYPNVHQGLSNMDIILCRNVLIYFDAQGVQKVARQLYDTLAQGGYLIPGPSDPLLAGYAPFETLMTPGGLVYRKGLPSNGLPRSTFSPSLPVQQADASLPARTQPDALPRLHDGSRIRQWPARLPVSADRLPAGAANDIVKKTKATVNAQEQACASTAPTAGDDLTAQLFTMALQAMQDSADTRALGLLRRVLYLDPSLAVVHFTLGLLHLRRGQTQAARKAFQNTLEHTQSLAFDAPVPLTDNEPAGRLRQAAQAQLAALDNKPFPLEFT